MLLIEEPNLYCENCFKLKRENNNTPACQTPRGCPIEDLATDRKLNALATKFRMARQLYDLTGISKMLEATYTELKIIGDPVTMLELESIWARWKLKHQSQTIVERTLRK